jgi:cell wall-associated NlpC family hydrolase
LKELLLIGTTVFALTSGSITAAQTIETPQRPERGNHVSVSMINKAELKAQAQAEFLKQQQLDLNAEKVNKAIKKLASHVGKTWYVFSGATPSGWDCSGLTMWFYEQLDIQLEHRASKQDTSGTATNNPKPGDLVVFHYTGNKDAYHVGIYIGNGKMIHAPKKGHLTRIDSVKSFGGDYSDITYRNFIESSLGD